MKNNKLFDKNGNSKWILVNSSNLFAIRYNIIDRVLKVQFGNPTPVSQYSYQRVSLSQFTGLIQAPSHGSYFANTIRKHPVDYPYTQEPVDDIDAFNASWVPGKASDPKKGQ